MNHPLSIPNSIIVKIDLDTIGAGDTFEFKASQQMKGKNVTHFCVLSESEILSYKNTTPVAANGLPSINVSLFLSSNANTTKYNKIPASVIAYNSAIESKGFVGVNGSSIDWDQSEIEVVSGTNLTAGESFLLLCIYQ